MTMHADDVLQPMYELVYLLYPDPAVALTVTLEAADRLAFLRRLREQPTGPAWRQLPEAWLPQYCVYLASDPHELTQERPTADTYLIRYLKCLIWWTMDQPCAHVALALGCFLCAYSWDDLVPVAPAFSIRNLSRVSGRLASRLQARFPRAHVFPGDHSAHLTRRPPAHDWQLVQHALARFTPWGAAHVPPHPWTSRCWQPTLTGPPPTRTGTASMP
jgi:hypothetical protein